MKKLIGVLVWILDRCEKPKVKVDFVLLSKERLRVVLEHIPSRGRADIYGREDNNVKIRNKKPETIKLRVSNYRFV